MHLYTYMFISKVHTETRNVSKVECNTKKYNCFSFDRNWLCLVRELERSIIGSLWDIFGKTCVHLNVTVRKNQQGNIGLQRACWQSHFVCLSCLSLISSICIIISRFFYIVSYLLSLAPSYVQFLISSTMFTAHFWNNCSNRSSSSSFLRAFNIFVTAFFQQITMEKKMVCYAGKSNFFAYHVSLQFTNELTYFSKMTHVVLLI